MRTSAGLVYIDQGNGREWLLSNQNACPVCNLSFPELSPAMFSFNSPIGMCPECNGLGTRLEVDVNLIVDHPELSILDGASRWYGDIRKKKNNWHMHHMQALAEHYHIDLELPWQDLPQHFRHVLLYGSGDDKIHFKYENQDGTWKGETNRVEHGAVVKSFGTNIAKRAA